ncbi:MAG: ECF transporter S component [Bacilli bacterium]|nr:ECF transporter S component [Bacilli bacterium]
MRNKRVLEITTAGVFGAIILFLSLVPAPWGLTWGFFRIAGGVEVTIIHIPVIIGGIFGGKRVAIILGFMFGLGSLFAALIYGGLFAVFFYNPLVSILPRILFGYFIYLFYKWISKVIKIPVLSMALSMALSTFAHSIMVLTMLYLFSFNSDIYLSVFPNTGILQFMLAILGLNAVLEIILAVVVGTPVGLRIKEYKEQE